MANMRDSTPLYHSRIIKGWVDYLSVNYPNIDIASVLKYAGIEAYELTDEGHWLVKEQINRFHEILAAKTDKPDIAREVGRFSVTSRASGALKQYALGFITPEKAYSVMEKLHSNYSRAAIVKTKSIGPDKIEINVSLMPNVTEAPYQCLYRTGAFEAVAKLFTGKCANIEHPICLHKGGDYCLYTISWEKSRTFVWKRILIILSYSVSLPVPCRLPFVARSLASLRFSFCHSVVEPNTLCRTS